MEQVDKQIKPPTPQIIHEAVVFESYQIYRVNQDMIVNGNSNLKFAGFELLTEKFHLFLNRAILF
jgi:hypothetical protein